MDKKKGDEKHLCKIKRNFNHLKMKQAESSRVNITYMLEIHYKKLFTK